MHLPIISGIWRRLFLSLLGAATCLALLALLAFPAMASIRHNVNGHIVSVWNIEDGLPHNLPLSISQDSTGRVWISTWEGVARFDGHAFTVFDHRNTAGVALYGSAALLPESDGSLLVGGGNGLYRHHQGEWSLLHPRLKGVHTEIVVRKRDGWLWLVSGDRLYGLSPSGEMQEVALGEGPVQIFGMVELDNGQLLLGAETGLYYLSGDKVNPWPLGNALANTAVLHISADDKGWLLATTGGAWQLTKQYQLQTVGPRERVDRAVRDRHGTVWLNLHEGDLLKLDARGTLTAFPMEGPRARTIFVDRDGALWGGYSRGVFRISQGVADAIPEAAGHVRAVLEDADGSIWLGHSNGLRRLSKGTVKEVLKGSVLALGRTADGNGIWVGTYDRGVFQVDRDGRITDHIPIAQGRTYGLIRSVLQTKDGTVWIGTGAMGLLRWRNGVLKRVGDETTLPPLLVQVLYEDPAGGIWVGTGSGMAHVSDEGAINYFRPEVDFPANAVFDFLRDDDGTLWIASDRGLLRKQGGRYAVFNQRRGMPQDKLFRILDDGRYLWLASGHGVFRVARDDLAAVAGGRLPQLSVTVVDHSDGMPGGPGNGGSWPAGWRTHDGYLLFPTGEGVGRVAADRIASRELQPVSLTLDAIHIDGVLLDPHHSVHLAPEMQRLVFSFTGLAFQAPERVRYRYRLTGYDKQWMDAGSIGQAMFTNLPAGHYQFEVEAMSLPVDWSDRTRIGSQSISVTVAAPLWQHPVSVAVLLLGLLAALYGVMWLRMLHYRRQQRRLNRIIHQRTDELLEKNLALEASGRERDALVQKLAHQASHDALTGLPNRRAGDACLQSSIAKAKRGELALCVALLDVDLFKRVNDKHGHEAGDSLLRDLPRALAASDCRSFFVARHGGEEFLLVLEDLSLAMALYRMERLRYDIEQQPVPLPDGGLLHYTVSIGVAAFGPTQDTMQSLLAAADARLYEAKRAGRNRVAG